MGFSLRFLENPPDFGSGSASVRKRLRVQRGLSLRDGDPLIVDDMHPPAEVSRIELRALAGAGQTARHRDMDDFVVILQQLFPQIDHVAGGRLGRMDFGTLQLSGVKLIRRDVDVLKILPAVDDDGHREEKNAVLRGVLRQHAAVCVRDDRCSHRLSLIIDLSSTGFIDFCQAGKNVDFPAS